MKNICPHLPDTLAAALHPDGLQSASPKLREHLHACPVCRAEFSATQNFSATLKANTPQALPSKDLAEKILAALPPLEVGRPKSEVKNRTFDFRLPTSPLLRYAAAILLLASLAVWQYPRLATKKPPHFPSAPDPAQSHCAWLLDQQQPDGLWRPQTSGGSPAYRPAISALTTLALFRHAQPSAHDPQSLALSPQPLALSSLSPAILRAQDALFGLQQPSGAFDPTSTSRAYNHGIVTTALLAMRDAPDRDPELRRAISFIIATQHPAGGWGYTDADAPNTAITAWHLEALSRAVALDWDEARAPLNRGLRWLRACATPSGHFAYQPETASPSASHSFQPSAISHQPSSNTSATLDAIAAATLLSAGSAYPELVAAATRALALLATTTPP